MTKTLNKSFAFSHVDVRGVRCLRIGGSEETDVRVRLDEAALLAEPHKEER